MRIFLLLSICWLSYGTMLATPPDSLAGKRLAVYMSSKTFTLAEAFDMEVTQFLTVDEDRSWVGRMKEEFMIRIGWLFTEQLQALSGADTVIFLNADLPRGRAFLDTYDPETGRLRRSAPEALQDIDHILVLSPFTLGSRIHRSVYIRSNRMISERIPVEVVDLTFTWLVPRAPSQVRSSRVCYDRLETPRPAEPFDLHAGRSHLGKVLSQVFSQWWDQEQGTRPSACEP